MEGQGGLGAASGGKAPSYRRVSAASETTPLFLHAPVDEGNEPLVFDEALESAYFPSRWKATLEATVSKVFWDGFGWERFAYLSAKGLGQGPTTLVRHPRCRQEAAHCLLCDLSAHPWCYTQAFCLMTGLGAALAVFVGQLSYASGVYALSAASARARGDVVPTAKTLLMGLEFAALISAAAFLAGFTWEPVVNALIAGCATVSASANVVFLLVLLSTWLVQGAVFFVGLHGARFVMATLLRFEAIEAPLSTDTLVYDFTLSLSIGSASGFFVATDAFANNALTRAFGVQPWTGPWTASARGGASMVVGFLLAQGVQNAVFPANTTWADVRKKGKQQLRYTEEEVLLPYRTPYG